MLQDNSSSSCIYRSPLAYIGCTVEDLTVKLGAGVYEIVDRGGRRTSFAYKLEIPQEPGEVQKELQIRQEASYTLSIKVRMQPRRLLLCWDLLTCLPMSAVFVPFFTKVQLST